MNLPIDQEYIIDVTRQLVKIDSTNPSLTPAGAGEEEISQCVADLLTDLGLEVQRYELAPKRWNVIGRLPGRGGGRSLMLNAHTDTVGVDGMVGNPFGAEIRQGRMYGRGTQDMKGSLAAMIGAVKAVLDGGVTLAGDLLITAVSDEEYLSIGSEDIVKRVHADAAIVTEPTDLNLCRAHRGFIWYDVETFGRAAHGSRYNEGIDANMRMGRFLAELDGLEQELRTRPAHSLVGTPSLHASLLQGGQEISIYAAHCLLKIERRTNPGEQEAQATAELQAIIDRLAAADPTFKAALKATFSREAFEVSPEAAVVRSLAQAMEAHLGRPPRHSGQSFWTDAALFANAGMETVLIGPIGAGLHSAEEWVDLQSVVDLAAILARTAVDYCGVK